MRKAQLDVPHPKWGEGEKGKKRARVDCQHWMPPGKLTGTQKREKDTFFYCILFVPFAFVSGISINFQK